MTEADWLTSNDPQAMLSFLRATGQATDRKLRLFAACCCREVWDLIELMERLDIGDGAVAVQLAERLADGQGTAQEVARWVIDRHGLTDSGCSPFGHLLCYALPGLAAADAHQGAAHAALGAGRARDRDVRHLGTQRRGEHPGLPSEQSRAEGRAAQLACLVRLCVPLRDIFGPLPFRPLAPIAPSLLAWNDALIPRLAQAAYETRALPAGHLDPDRLAVLADALTDAACDDASLLEHLRSEGPHWRGCWAVDLLLARP